MYRTYQRFSYNTCPIRFPVGKAAKALLYVLVFVAMVVAGVAVFAAVHMVAVAALSALASAFAGIVAALSTAVAVVVTVASAVLSAAAYAVIVALWCAVRCVMVLALVRALPVLWRAAVALYSHRDGLLLAGKALCYAGVVVGCFLGAILVAPLVLAVAGKIIVVSAVMAGAIVSGKVM